VLTPTDPSADVSSLAGELFWTCFNVTRFNDAAAEFTGAIKVAVNASLVVTTPTICVLDDSNNTCFNSPSSPTQLTSPPPSSKKNGRKLLAAPLPGATAVNASNTTDKANCTFESSKTESLEGVYLPILTGALG
jgi:hypothetical protein